MKIVVKCLTFVILSYQVHVKVCNPIPLTPQSTIFQSCRDGATASWVLPVVSGSKVYCSRTQHVGGRIRTPRPLAPESDAYH